MTKIIICLIQCSILIAMQMVSQIAVCDDLKEEQFIRGHAKKGFHVRKNEVQTEFETIKRTANYSFNN